jgi:hypothetical protein
MTLTSHQGILQLKIQKQKYVNCKNKLNTSGCNAQLLLNNKGFYVMLLPFNVFLAKFIIELPFNAPLDTALT